MRWYFGYPVLATGLAFAAHVFMPSGSEDLQATPAARALTPERAPVVEVAPPGLTAPSRVAAFSPGARFHLPEAPQTSVLDYLASKISGLDPAPAATAVSAKPVVISPWKSAVIRAADVAAAAPNASGEAQRVALTRDIQRELKRVGCYGGEVDGVWGGGSRRAILTFMDRVNASLPTSEPDVFILSLLRTQNASVCGATCPSDQSMTASGRCLPNVIVAQSDGRETDPIRDGDTTTVLAVPAPVPAHRSVVAEADIPALAVPSSRPVAFEGRMSIGGPRPDDIAPVTGPAASDGYSRTAELETSSIDGDLTGGDLADDAAASAVTVAPDSFARPRPGKVKARSRAERPKKSRYVESNYRHVQSLFEHPLGRM